ncbi:peptidoglycan-binding domain-containing protein [Nocardiopsis synnemataformans]|uniref:peptidoglycan-binding domain-containing protein n=1 Tax=Nocardiopsis synnemataformans TaxID=61305 RepID=UPI003EBF5F9A
MAITVNNSLSGPSGTQPSASTLARTARAGAVGIVAPERSAYSADRTLYGLTSVRIDTGHHRANSTPRLEVSLPAAPWRLRWYVHLPSLRAVSSAERRWVARLGTMGLVLHETADGNIGSRLQPGGLAATPVAPTATGGFAVAFGQWMRIEVSSDGANTVVTVDPEHGGGGRIFTYTGTALPGGITAEVSAYRFESGVLLQPGDTDASTGGLVTPRQEQILIWDPDELPVFGADGDYGGEMSTAVANFQTAYGLVPVDGEIGPETGAAMDLVVAEIEGTALPPPTYVAQLAAGDGTTPIGAAAPPGGDAVASLAALVDDIPGRKAATGSAVASLGALAGETGGRGGNAIAALGAAGVVDGTKAVGGSVEGLLGAVTDASGTKHAYGTAVASLGVVATVEGTKHTAGSAVAELALNTLATQLIEPVPPVQAVARIVNQPEGTARASSRPAGAAHPTSRIDGTATRR